MHLQGGLSRLRILVVSLGTVLGVVAVPDQAAANSALVAVSGGDTRTRDFIQTHAEEFLKTAEFDILGKEDAAEMGVSAEAIKKCVDRKANCMKAIIESVAVDRLIYFEIKKRDGMLVARLYNASGAQERMEQRECGDCSSPEKLAPLARELAGRLFDIEVKSDGKNGTSSPEAGAWIEVETDPPQARVSIDGRYVGPSGRSYKVEPGTRRVTAELDGHEKGQETIEVSMDKTARVQIKLIKKAVVEPPGAGGLKWLTLAGGVVVAGGGVAALLIHDDARFDADGSRLPKKWNTLPYGIGGVAVGGALIGLSIYMHYKDKTNKPIAQPAKPTVVLQPFDRGLGLGFAGAF